MGLPAPCYRARDHECCSSVFVHMLWGQVWNPQRRVAWASLSLPSVSWQHMNFTNTLEISSLAQGRGNFMPHAHPTKEEKEVYHRMPVSKVRGHNETPIPFPVSDHFISLLFFMFPWCNEPFTQQLHLFRSSHSGWCAVRAAGSLRCSEEESNTGKELWLQRRKPCFLLYLGFFR